MNRANFSLTPAQKIDARNALRVLEGSGVSLTDAAHRAVEGRRAMKRAQVKDVADLFLQSRLARRAASVEWYEVRLGFITHEFGERIMDTVTRTEFRKWLETLVTGHAAKAAIARCARALWRWALRQDPPVAAIDVSLGLTFAVKPREGAQPTILTPDECGKILAGAGRHLNATALMLFAGVRPSEVCGKGKPWLKWSHVSVEEKWIRIPADIAKIAGHARIIEGIPPALWKFLEPGKAEETIGKSQSRSVIARAQQSAGFGENKTWEADALRHTFATYALALTNDPGKVAGWLGHDDDPTMLHQRYRGLALQKHAKEFFGL